ncbi:MAG: hypothetical protein J5736_00625, partial [Bacilli bacterium]|nr:hypothetical protein [Bacilli bacterium]
LWSLASTAFRRAGTIQNDEVDLIIDRLSSQNPKDDYDIFLTKNPKALGAFDGLFHYAKSKKQYLSVFLLLLANETKAFGSTTDNDGRSDADLSNFDLFCKYVVYESRTTLASRKLDINTVESLISQDPKNLTFSRDIATWFSHPQQFYRFVLLYAHNLHMAGRFRDAISMYSVLLHEEEDSQTKSAGYCAVYFLTILAECAARNFEEAKKSAVPIGQGRFSDEMVYLIRRGEEENKDGLVAFAKWLLSIVDEINDYQRLFDEYCEKMESLLRANPKPCVESMQELERKEARIHGLLKDAEEKNQSILTDLQALYQNQISSFEKDVLSPIRKAYSTLNSYHVLEGTAKDIYNSIVEGGQTTKEAALKSIDMLKGTVKDYVSDNNRNAILKQLSNANIMVKKGGTIVITETRKKQLQSMASNPFFGALITIGLVLISLMSLAYLGLMVFRVINETGSSIWERIGKAYFPFAGLIAQASFGLGTILVILGYVVLSSRSVRYRPLNAFAFVLPVLSILACGTAIAALIAAFSMNRDAGPNGTIEKNVLVFLIGAFCNAFVLIMRRINILKNR